MLTHEQLLARRSSIGSSEIAAVLGLSSYAGPHDVWAQKVGEADPFEGNAATEFGEIMEPVLIKWYADQNPGLIVEPNQVLGEQRVYTRDDWMSATPDATAWKYDDVVTRHSKRIVEAKTANWRQADKWGEPGTDQIPAEYLCQVMWQMAVLNLDRADIVVLLDREFRVYTVHRRMDIEEAMIAKAREFWGYVERRELPPIDGSEACFHALARRNHGKEYLTDDDDIRAMFTELAEAKAEMERAEAHKKLVSAKIMDGVGEDHKGFKCELGSIGWVERGPSQRANVDAMKAMLIAKGATKEEIDSCYTESPGYKYVTVRMKGEKA